MLHLARLLAPGDHGHMRRSRLGIRPVRVNVNFMLARVVGVNDVQLVAAFNRLIDVMLMLRRPGVHDKRWQLAVLRLVRDESFERLYDPI